MGDFMGDFMAERQPERRDRFQFSIFEMLGTTMLLAFLLAQGHLIHQPVLLMWMVLAVVFFVALTLAARRDRRQSTAETVICAALVAIAIADCFAIILRGS